MRATWSRTLGPPAASSGCTATGCTATVGAAITRAGSAASATTVPARSPTLSTVRSFTRPPAVVPAQIGALAAIQVLAALGRGGHRDHVVLGPQGALDRPPDQRLVVDDQDAGARGGGGGGGCGGHLGRPDQRGRRQRDAE